MDITKINTSITVSAIIKKADGTIVDLGVIAGTKKTEKKVKPWLTLQK